MSDSIIELSDDSDFETSTSNDNTPKKGDETSKVATSMKVTRTEPHHVLMINGINIKMPVKPYRCQVALMSKVITALNKSENCILESPTGTGKTLALLCATLAWQQNEQSRISQELVSAGDGALTDNASPYSTPVKKFENLNTTSTPEKLFNKPVYGERSIYDAEQSSGDCGDFNMKRKWEECKSPSDNGGNGALVTIHKKPNLETSIDLTQGYGAAGLVTIHKKPNLDQTSIDLTQGPYTPTKNSPTETGKGQEIPVKKRLPIIYYGSRTHKQLEQVIKEFERTPYCGVARMSVLSSRDYSCVLEYDSHRWPSKNDMCRECIKKKKSLDSKEPSTNCRYYENRATLAHQVLPPAFNLQQLVDTGRSLDACPYYGARLMAAASEIVFCPYNYLIDPAIRNSMNISLRDNIVIIDEAHNIEGVCRDAATFTVHQELIAAAMVELEKAAFYRYSNQGGGVLLEVLKQSLSKWDYWFVNQKRLLDTHQASKNNGEILFAWKTGQDFVTTLDNHDIGSAQFAEFSHNVQQLCRQLNDDPRAFIGVTSATSGLLETLETILGYLFRNNGEHREDFVMAIGMSEESKYKKQQQQSPYLSVLCMHPGVVFGAARAARAAVLASGTLAPLPALAAELAAPFPHRASPPHVVPPDRVWIGVVSSGPDGEQLRLTFAQCREPRVQDALGRTLVRACRATPHGVLAFLPSYWLLTALQTRWRETGLWDSLTELKHVFTESKSVSEHNDIMDEYYSKVLTRKGALLMGVYRGKVAEGMDFRDHQARLVVAFGIPFPSRTEPAVEHKMQYNNRRRGAAGGTVDVLSGDEWYTIQAFRALNQALGRCIRHRGDWGAALLLDARYGQQSFARRLPAWLHQQLVQKMPYTYEQLERDASGLKSFMQRMTLQDEEDDLNAIVI